MGTAVHMTQVLTHSLTHKLGVPSRSSGLNGDLLPHNNTTSHNPSIPKCAILLLSIFNLEHQVCTHTHARTHTHNLKQIHIPTVSASATNASRHNAN